MIPAGGRENAVLASIYPAAPESRGGQSGVTYLSRVAAVGRKTTERRQNEAVFSIVYIFSFTAKKVVLAAGLEAWTGLDSILDGWAWAGVCLALAGPFPLLHYVRFRKRLERERKRIAVAVAL